MSAPTDDYQPEMKPIREMSDRELAEETLFWMRIAGQAVAQLQNGGIGAMMGQMMRGMTGGKGR